MNTTDDPAAQSEYYLNLLKERERLKELRVPGVRTVLVVLSSAATPFDVESLRYKISSSYPEAAVFFMNTSGNPYGVPSPQKVDLLIDLSGPGQRQGWFFAKKMRRLARFAVGRNAGWFRKGSYDRIFDEKDPSHQVPTDVFERERRVQKEVLALAGVPLVPAADTTVDRSKKIALELPPLAGESR